MGVATSSSIARLPCELLAKTLSLYFPTEEATIAVCCRQIYEILGGSESGLGVATGGLDADFLASLFQRYLERKQDDDFRARKCMVALGRKLEMTMINNKSSVLGQHQEDAALDASSSCASAVKHLFRAYAFPVDGLVAVKATSNQSRRGGGGLHQQQGTRKRSYSSGSVVGGPASALLERRLSGGAAGAVSPRTPSRIVQNSRLLQGTTSSRNKVQIAHENASGKKVIPFSQSAFAHLVPGASSDEEAGGAGDFSGQQHSAAYEFELLCISNDSFWFSSREVSVYSDPFPTKKGSIRRR